MQVFWKLTRDTIQKWQDDNVTRDAAALSYFLVFSIAPMLVIVTALTGAILSRQQAKAEIIQWVNRVISGETATTLETMIDSAASIGNNPIATMIGIGVLLFAATNFFFHLESALNDIWNAEPQFERAIIAFVYKRSLSFAFVLGLGILLAFSLIFNSILVAISSYLDAQMVGMASILQVINWLVSITIVAFVFAIIFKILPDTDIQWRDVFPGAFLTAILFTLGQFLIGLYIGRSSIASAYGAAGSLAVLLLWLYYTMQILLLGAEFTYIYTHRYGSKKGEADTQSI